MFIQNALKVKNNIWRYALGIFIIFIFTQIGSIPFVVAIFNKVGIEGAANLDPAKMMTILENSNLTFFYTLLTFFVGFIGFLIVIKYLHNQSFVSVTTSRKSIDYKRVLTSFSVISLILFFYTISSFYALPDEYIIQFNLNDFLILLLIAVIFIPIQTSLEEYVFRGYLMQGFGVLAKNKWVPLFLTSFLFGMLHYYNPEIMKLGSILLVHYIATGLFLGIITLMDEGMELALGFHAGNNLIIALMVTSDWTVFQTSSIFKYIGEPNAIYMSLFSTVIIYPLLLFYFSKKYNWTDWKDKLIGNIN
ncbi:MAG: CPBP family intramembrane glutamic endopeptidase [Bacteroidota bacterium]|jgi:membrane protease YdiL (CAAX protease family)|tara:strand:- start:623 stop:1537 length:915 start_codon:yes stop_codon:yes gene_type:complete